MSKHSNENVNAAELRGIFLSSAESVIAEIIGRASGQFRNNQIVDKDLERAWNALVPILQQANDIKRIEISSIADIVKSASEGKISIKDAKELMQLFREAIPASLEESA